MLRVSSKEKLDKVFAKAERRDLSRTSPSVLMTLALEENLRGKGYNRATVFWALAGKVKSMLRVSPTAETYEAA